MNPQEQLQLYRCFHVIGDRHVLKILYQLDTFGEQTFSQLRDSLHINPRTLSSRLKILRSSSFIKSDRSHDNLRVFYSLDNNQRSVKKILDAYERLATEL